VHGNLWGVKLIFPKKNFDVLLYATLKVFDPAFLIKLLTYKKQHIHFFFSVWVDLFSK
jgi:hypothetical protein